MHWAKRPHINEGLYVVAVQDKQETLVSIIKEIYDPSGIQYFSCA